MGLSSIVTAEEKRFFGNRTQPWVYAPRSLTNWDGSVTITDNNGITGPAIDCSHFVMEAMLAGGYNVTQLSSFQLAAIVKGASSPYYSVATTIQAGDIIVFNGHCGIVASVTLTNGVVTGGTFDNAENQMVGLKEKVPFSIGGRGHGWGTKSIPIIGFLAPKASIYNPTAATMALDAINNQVNQGLLLNNPKSAPYFSPAHTNSNSTSSLYINGNTYDVGEDTNGTTGTAPWSQTTADINNDQPWASVTNAYDANDQLTQTTYNFEDADNITFAANTSLAPQYNSTSPR